MFSSVSSSVGRGFLAPAPTPAVSPPATDPQTPGRSGSSAPLRFAGPSDSMAVGPSEALCLAAQNGDFRRLRSSLRAGFNPDFEDSLGNRILHYAAEAQDREAVQALIRAGAQVDALDGSCHRRSPLMIAARRGALDLVKPLLQAGASIELPDNVYGCRPLHHAAIGGHVAVVKALLDAGAEVTAKDYKGATPLQLAQKKGHAEVVQLLTQAEAAIPKPFPGFPLLPLVFPESVFLAKRPQRGDQ